MRLRYTTPEGRPAEAVSSRPFRTPCLAFFFGLSRDVRTGEHGRRLALHRLEIAHESSRFWRAVRLEIVSPAIADRLVNEFDGNRERTARGGSGHAVEHVI